MKFKLKSKYEPAGGQPEAIEKLAQGFGVYNQQTLLGITGSGKTFIMANLIERVQKPTLVLAHNKTLAAQLYQEIKQYFPENKVEYFISYYDYYQPESYVPTSDTYIEKEATVNKEIEKMRLKTLANLLSRRDVIVVASISCIYGAGDPEDFKHLSLKIQTDTEVSRSQILNSLVDMLYERNDHVLEEGKFRVRGDTVEIFPSYLDTIYRIEMFGDEIEAIKEIDSVTGETITSLDELEIYPAKQFVASPEKQEKAMEAIKKELEEWAPKLSPLEEERIRKRTKYDLEMIEEVGYCSGIENYSRHFEQRAPGTPPKVLLDYFEEDFLFIIDESHQTLPQAHGMYNGDYARKKNLVDFGFRLPCAYDNRPLKFEEFEKYLNNVVYVSATPAEYEIKHSGQLVEQIYRPTGLLDPEVTIEPAEGQVQNLFSQIQTEISQEGRVLVTTLTKRMAEELTNFLAKEGIKVRYLHSDIDSLDRIELIRDLRAGEFDVLVGINLLREGLDIPEVSLVAILDADKEGFLRNERSLIQTIGRAARNDQGRVILYADKITKSIRAAVDKTRYRRKKQQEFNKKHGITPKTIYKEVAEKKKEISSIKHLPEEDIHQKITQLETDMEKAANNLDFEKAIELRDTLDNMKKQLNTNK